jgi:ribosome-associated translation inhibitor RaiA
VHIWNADCPSYSADSRSVCAQFDKSCKLQVRTNLGLVQVVEMDRDLYAAIDLASERLQRTLARLFDREHFQNNGRWRAAGVFRRRHGSRSNDGAQGLLP